MLMHALRLIALVAALSLLLGIAGTLAESPGNSPFTRTWARVDRPVAAGKTSRTWMWGPQANGGLLLEAYDEAPDGSRTVQYYDKSRMEVTHPEGDSASVWYVTNGLLSLELVTGRLQLGDNHFEQRRPAEVNVAGDADDATGPTYATFSGLLTSTGEAESAIDRGLRRDGSVYSDAGYAAHNIGTAGFVPETRHWIAQPFWDFMTSSGVVYENGRFTRAGLFVNPFYATGFPITEAYWADVKVAGTYRHVLLQCFERRCLTYTPGNPPGFETEAGNVGQHYFQWRYAGTTPVAAPSPTPTPTPSAPRAATWRELHPSGPIPNPRGDHTLVADAAGEHVYLFGGHAGGQVFGDLWVYDVAGNGWAQLFPGGDAPGARFGHNAVFDAAGNRMLVFGGQAASGFYNDLWAYDVSGNRWERPANTQEPGEPLDRYGAGGAWDPASGALYITHGFTSDGRYDDTWAYSTTHRGWADRSAAGVRPEPRCLLNAIIDPVRNRLLLFGGQSNTAGFLGDLWSYDLGSAAWTRIDTAGPSARNLYAWAWRPGSDTTLLFGGRTAAGDSSELWAFDLAADSWSLLPASGPAPSARHDHDAVWLASTNTLLVFGGNAAGDDLNDLWEASVSQ